MSNFSDKRLREELAQAREGNSMSEAPIRRRRDVTIVALTFAGSLVSNFIFFKAEIAAVCWFLTLVFCADLLLSFQKLARLKIHWRAAIALLVVASGVAISYTFLLEQYRSQHASLVEGDLIPIEDGKDHSRELPKLQFGDEGAILEWAGGDKPMLNIDRDKIKLVRSNGKLLFSITIRDYANNLIAEIKDNHWTVSSSTTNCWDKNYTQDSLEVKDGRGRVVLQVRLLPDRVQLQAEFPQPKGAPSEGGIFEQDKYSKDEGIVARFQYPSRSHWGQLSGNYAY